MGIDALTCRDDGTRVETPRSREEWKPWVSAGRTRNWMLDDPLIDWLQLYGPSRNYIPKEELKGYDAKLEFLPFIFEQGRRFEAGILALLQAKFDTVTIAQDRQDILDLDKASETFSAMRRGAPILYQPVLWDAQNLTYGSPDFLIRSDILHRLFPGAMSEADASAGATDLGSPHWHYRVVDTKFSTITLNARGTELHNGGSATAYKAQLYVYNRMLGRLQGYEPPESYVLGRGWQLKSRGETFRSDNALERLGPVSQLGAVANKFPLAEAVDNAIRWIRRVRFEGEGWQLLPTPSTPELYPNMGNADDGSLFVELAPGDMEPGYDDPASSHNWKAVKSWLADELKELTALWKVGVGKRNLAHSQGVYRWDDPKATPENLGIGGAKNPVILAKLLSINTAAGPPVRPAAITKTREAWHSEPTLEFYVDFEFCTDLNDDFSKLPHKGGQPIIFMIGCGHLENGEWRFSSFATDRLTEEEELRIILEWTGHMAAVRDRLDPGNAQPRVVHWAAAEVSALERSYNSARQRHGDRAVWPEVNWFDFLSRVMREEPVVVRGALGFGLKSVANAFHAHGFIETNWADSPIDGLGAMVGAWRCEEEAARLGVGMAQAPLMAEIARYNEVDCRVMMEIARYLRARH